MRYGNCFTTEFLDQVEQRIVTDDVPSAIEELMSGLWWRRSRSSKKSWSKFISEEVQNHSLLEILQEDPITDHALRQPRGYPGDADLLDYMYFGIEKKQREGISRRGQEIFYFLYFDPACRAIRTRMRVIAKKIDEISDQFPARILSIGCGHLREATHSQAITKHRIKQFVALDQDPESLNRVEHELSQYGVTIVQKSIKDLILKDENLGKFDLIYSTGLYDYLSDKAAKLLTKKLFSSLKPEGTLLIANALPDIHASGYMEAIMNWHLIYRNDGEMYRLLELLNHNEYSASIFKEPNGQIVFLEVCKFS